MEARFLLARTVLVATLLLLLAPGVRADIIYEPGPDPTFESLQKLTLEVMSEGVPLATSSVPANVPISLTYQVGYGDQMFTQPDYTPETKAEQFQWILEDNVTYLELWSGEPFTTGAVLVESKQLGPSSEGTVTFAPIESGSYFLVFFSSQEIRDKAAYCVRYEVSLEDCADPSYFIEYPVSESRKFFSLPIDSPEQNLETQPYPFAGIRLTVEAVTPGISNVLFLPGIKGSRLYRPTDSCDPDLALSCPGVKLWEPSGNLLLQDLFLNSSGGSGRNDIYTKEGDIVSEVLGQNFYASFVNQMDGLKADGTLVDWKPIAYDWRLSLDDIVSKGVRHGDKIYYQEQSDTPYIEQSLKELASTSPTGKVSIIAHSNGGLVTKRLMQRLEANGDAGLVDKIIFVGVPQSGAPQAMAGLLYGYGEALPIDGCAGSALFGWLCSLFGSRDIARELAEHSPMAYHLLPSQAYFDQILDADHPIAKFTATTAYAEERNRYGTTIDSAQQLYDFLEAKDGGRTKPDMTDIARANVLSASFLNYGREIHDAIDSWTPPQGVAVHQIAGWGMNTVVGVEFYEQRKLLGGYREMYRPIFVEDGDKVVPVPSALLMGSGYAQNYWIDLPNASLGGASNIDHSNLLELTETRILVRDLILGRDLTLPEFISRSQPATDGGDRLIFFLHSPLTLELYDEDGNHTGETTDGGFDEEIPDVEYGEFGDVKYIIAPPDDYDVVLRGKDTGVFSLDLQKISNDEITASMTLADAPATQNTIASIDVTENLSSIGALQIDEDGDGTIDLELAAHENETVIFDPESTTVEQESIRPSHNIRKEINLADNSERSILPVTLALGDSQTVFHITEADLSQRGEEILASEMTHASSIPTQEIVANLFQSEATHDALGMNFLNWFGTLLYNFWDVLTEIFSSLFSK